MQFYITEINKNQLSKIRKNENGMGAHPHRRIATLTYILQGEEYTEPVVAKGPFVMNSQSEIAEAYQDFYAGKYGTIKFTK